MLSKNSSGGRKGIALEKVVGNILNYKKKTKKKTKKKRNPISVTKSKRIVWDSHSAVRMDEESMPEGPVLQDPSKPLDDGPILKSHLPFVIEQIQTRNGFTSDPQHVDIRKHCNYTQRIK